MSKPSSDHRVCAVCGVSKPLFAFLQMHEGEAHYGRVCAACRSEGKDIASESAEEVRSTNKKRIDSKSKTAEEIQYRLTLKRNRELDADERMHKEEMELEELTKKEDIRKKEITHRISFLNEQPQKKTTSSVNIKSEAVGRQMARERVVKEQNNQKNAQEEQRHKTEVDFSTTFVNPQYGNEERFKSTYFQDYRRWLGKGSPLNQRTSVDTPHVKHKQEKIKKEVDRITRRLDEEFNINKPGRRR